MGLFRNCVLLAGAAAVSLCAPAATGPALAQDVPTIRIGWTIPAEDTKYLMMKRPELFPALGSAYNIEWVQFQGTAPMAQAMIAGAVECSTQSALVLANGHLQGGLESYVVASHVDSTPGHFSPYWAVREDDPIREVADLRGKTVSINVLGSGLMGPLTMYLEEGGLDPRRDIRLVELGFSGSEDALRSGRVDAAVMNQPFARNAESAGGVRKLFSTEDVLTTMVQIFEVCSKAFVDEQPEVAEAYVRDLTSAMDLVLADRAQTIEVAASVTNIPVPVLEAYYMTENDFERYEGGAFQFDALQDMFDLYTRIGMLEGELDAQLFRHPTLSAPLR
ncbi:ABC transporter substrate-binding protein [Aureimonas populi]|uniref:ABC transporter substrate-binding protein n=1 Tax=Aureimonas populi TaxID=1701758 RepID=A0ABW5CKF6_9HYPH|nr:ABC transporter substrate-binding protein [Aureimonas populi]